MRLILIWCLLAIFAGTTNAQKTSHVILISIDGLRPDMYLDSTWPAPNLRALMKEGTYANHMKSVFPAYTYPSHTAMLTGALPARSKICYNQPPDGNGEWYWESKYVQVPTIWQLLHQSGLKTAAVMWPGTIGANIDYNISEIWSPNNPDDRITETRRHATPHLVDEIEKNATGILDSSNFSDGYFSLDENSARMAGYIFKKYKPAFLALHFATVDGVQHAYGRDGDSVRLAVESNDRAIGDVLEAIEQSGLKDSTTVIIVGDHGFCTIHEIFRPNMLIKNVPAIFMSAGGSAFLYRYEEASESDVPAIIKLVKEKLDSLPKDQRKLFRIVDRKELDKMGADSFAILALAAEPGLVFSNSTGPKSQTNQGPGTSIQKSQIPGLFVPTSGGHHGYDPNIPEMYTGFIAAGAGIQKGEEIPEINVVDIAPLVAKLLGIEFKTPDGKLVSGILK